ncbi:MAG TPA: penicillin-binding protein, partial [Chitinophagaceae bacterium]|nr:penicillin-binding protein [Chitinophagaceae bacterium]
VGIGAIVIDANITDTTRAWIYKQSPERFDDEKRIQRIRSGQLIDVWLQADKPVADSVKKNTEL